MLKTSFGIESTCFNNGKDAINCFKERLRNKCCPSVFKLVLTDIQMPEIDGY